MRFRVVTHGLLWALGGVLALGSAPLTADNKKPEKKADHGVVIDFSTLPKFTDNGDLSLQIEYMGAVAEPTVYKGPIDPQTLTQIYYENLRASGFTAKQVGKTKVRVLGWKDKKGVFHPAIHGTVTSKTIKRKQLPKVINPPQA